MATPDRGERATPRRVAELRAKDAALEVRIDDLAERLGGLERELAVALELVRARIGAELTMLRRIERRGGG